MKLPVDSAHCAEALHVLGTGTRLNVLRQLLEGSRCVSELGQALGIEQTLLSHHLRRLREAGFVACERRGKQVIYRLSDRVRIAGQPRGIELGCCRLTF